REDRNSWIAHAVSLYVAELARVLAPKERRIGARQICESVQQEYFEKFKKPLTPGLSHVTITRLANGGLTQSQSNAAKGWLLVEETEIVIGYALELARRGFPLSHQRLKDCVDGICRARLGDEFPADGVGVNWTQRFVEKHSARL
ncbi:hypothetical protein C8J57DRAFT_987967, partial [Mycena rebaudengoi]